MAFIHSPPNVHSELSNSPWIQHFSIFAVNVSSMYMHTWCRYWSRDENRPQGSHGTYTKLTFDLALYNAQGPSLMINTRLSMQIPFAVSPYTARRGRTALTASWSSWWRRPPTCSSAGYRTDQGTCGHARRHELTNTACRSFRACYVFLNMRYCNRHYMYTPSTKLGTILRWFTSTYSRNEIVALRIPSTVSLHRTQGPPPIINAHAILPTHTRTRRSMKSTYSSANKPSKTRESRRSISLLVMVHSFSSFSPIDTPVRHQALLLHTNTWPIAPLSFHVFVYAYR